MTATVTRPDVREVATERLIAAYGLAGSRRIESPRTWSGFVSRLAAQRLTGLAVAAWEDGRVDLLSDRADELVRAHREVMVGALRLEQAALSIAGELEEAGIPSVVLKGPALAHSVYPDPSWRPFGDLDLLVRTVDWRGALEVLAGLGYRRLVPEPRSGFDERFGKAATHVDGRGRLFVDLHRTLALGPYGLWIDPDELFGGTSAFELGGRALRRLDDVSLLLHACVHASLGWRPPQLWALRDVAQVATSASVDWVELEARSRRWRLTAVVAHAFRITAETLDVPLPAEAVAFASRTPRRRDRRLLEAYTTDRAWRGGTALSTLRAISGVRAKGAYLCSMLFPDRGFLAARSGGRPSYVRRLLVPVRWLRPRGER